jgi:hypothetical protein
MLFYALLYDIQRNCILLRYSFWWSSNICEEIKLIELANGKNNSEVALIQIIQSKIVPWSLNYPPNPIPLFRTFGVHRMFLPFGTRNAPMVLEAENKSRNDLLTVVKATFGPEMIYSLRMVVSPAMPERSMIDQTSSSTR